MAVSRALIAALMAAVMTFGATPVSIAQDDASAFRDLATAQDFRLRVTAALSLGKSRSPGARPALEKALGDSHQAVRTAAAAALGTLGDAAALPALRAAVAKETVPVVKAQMDGSIARLAGPAPARPAGKAKFIVALGKIENKSGVSGAGLVGALRSSTRARIALVAGAEIVAEGADPVAEGKSRNLPALAIDGSLTKLTQQQGKNDIGYAAGVEYIIRKMPDQTLKGTMKGAASAIADAKQVKGQEQLSQLQLDALSAAVDVALKNASPTFEAAAK
jgi:hypothetical protein